MNKIPGVFTFLFSIISDELLQNRKLINEISKRVDSFAQLEWLTEFMKNNPPDASKIPGPVIPEDILWDQIKINFQDWMLENHFISEYELGQALDIQIQPSKIWTVDLEHAGADDIRFRIKSTLDLRMSI